MDFPLQVCSIINDQQCDTVEQNQCRDVPEEICEMVAQPQVLEWKRIMSVNLILFQDCRTVDENKCNVIEEEYCRDVTRPVCVTRTELVCDNNIQQQNVNNNNSPQQQTIANNNNFSPSNVPVTNFDGTGNIGGFGRNAPVTSSRRDDIETDNSESESDEGKTVEEIFLSTGTFQRGANGKIKRPRIVPRRFKKNSNSRQDEDSQGSEQNGSLEEIFLTTGMFQRGEGDTIQSSNDARVELRRVRRQLSDSTGLGRQLGSNCEARLMNDCEDAIIQQCQIDKRERCSTVPAVKCEPAGPPQRQCRQVPRQVGELLRLFVFEAQHFISLAGVRPSPDQAVSRHPEAGLHRGDDAEVHCGAQGGLQTGAQAGLHSGMTGLQAYRPQVKDSGNLMHLAL